jgi:hypothetical protein
MLRAFGVAEDRQLTSSARRAERAGAGDCSMLIHPWPKESTAGLLLAAILLGLAGALPRVLASSGPELTEARNYGSVRLSYADLSSLVRDVHDVLASADGEAANCNPIEYLVVGDGVTSLRLAGDFSAGAFKSAPPTAFSVEYTYDCPDAPISRVEVWLSDSIRQSKVTGRSQPQVYALTALIERRIDGFGTVAGGPSFRFLTGSILLFLAGLLSLGSGASKNRLTRMILASSAPVISVSVWIFPWQKWLSGTAVYAGDASFLVRNSQLISVFGMVLTIVTFLAGPLREWWTGRGALSTEPPARAPRQHPKGR